MPIHGKMRRCNSSPFKADAASVPSDNRGRTKVGSRSVSSSGDGSIEERSLLCVVLSAIAPLGVPMLGVHVLRPIRGGCCYCAGAH